MKYIAIDIGAGSGRVIEGYYQEQKLQIREIHRFENNIYKVDDHDRWDIEKLFNEILIGLEMVKNRSIRSIGVDTWGVDFVLLDSHEDLLEQPVAYRDSRTTGMMDKFFCLMPKSDIYRSTGIQFMELNTLYQLFSLLRSDEEILHKAEHFLMIPDYINYLLTGVITNEYTNSTTTQMISADNRDWDTKIIEKLTLKESLFKKPLLPGEKIGNLIGNIAQQTGLQKTSVIAVSSHDTGSAIAAVPAEGRDWAYISSGTWCLMGIESTIPIKDNRAANYNFTNEGGANGTYRVLKNIMGLWILRGIKYSLNEELSYSELISLAEDSESFKHIVHVNDSRFFNPDSMCEAIDSYCLETDQKPPTTPGEYIRCAEEGLAFLYRETLEELREISDTPINRIHTIGGGVKDKLMLKLTASSTGIPVIAGPIEATAIGNIVVQAMADGMFNSLEEARKSVYDSFDIERFEPDNIEQWNREYLRYRNIKEKTDVPR